MKKLSLMIALGLAAMPGLASAADFSGLWIRDAAQSTGTNPSPLYWITRDGPAGGGPGGEAGIVIAQTPTTVQVTSGNKPLRVYTTDGTGRTVKADTGVTDVTVSAAHRGNNLVITTVHPYSGLPGSVTATTTETWSLSPDGRTMTVDTVRAVPGMTQAVKEVYNKRS